MPRIKGVILRPMNLNETRPADLACALWRDEEGGCSRASVVAVQDPAGATSWGCEHHAGEALAAIGGARIDEVSDWDAARRLLELPWNHSTPGLAQ